MRPNVSPTPSSQVRWVFRRSLSAICLLRGSRTGRLIYGIPITSGTWWASHGTKEQLCGSRLDVTAVNLAWRSRPVAALGRKRSGGSVVANTDVILPTAAARELPGVRSIGMRDLRDALAMGLEDFRAMPTHVIFLSLIYPVIGLVLFRAMFGHDLIPLLYPLAAGFPLVGPFAAIGLYELSRRRELGLDTSWRHAFDIIHSPSLRPICLLGGLLLIIFTVCFVMVIVFVYAKFGDYEPTTLGEFARRVLFTPQGQDVIMIGNAVGFLFAALAFALSVVSFPLLLDRNVGVVGAIITSIRKIGRAHV